MAVVKETYSAAPTWTASGVADLLRDAFIDAGLMTAWYDSFTNTGIENRILEVIYNGSKTYGKCYYWFMIDTTSVRVSVASGWNASTDVPTGTQYSDYYSTATNTTANHYAIISSLSTATQFDVVRYTSAIDTDYSWFVLRNGSTPFPFFIAPASAPVVTWLDLNKFLFHHIILPEYSFSASTATTLAETRFLDAYRLRRSYRDGQGLRSNTSASNYAVTNSPLHSYRSMANNATGSASSASSTSSHIAVPYGFTQANSAFTSEYTPVIFGYSYSPYITEAMPNDFGLQFSYLSTSFSFGNRVVVSSGVEEWEVMDFRNNSTTTSGSPLLLARVV